MGRSIGKARGYSLLELAVVLTVIGVSAFIFAAMVRPDRTGQAGGAREGETETVSSSENVSNDIPASLTRAEARLRGFIRSHNRLPCPDVDGDGLEDCGGGASVNQVGVAPYRSMGLSQPMLNRHQQPVRYGVYRRPDVNARLDRDLATLKNRFDPLLPGGELTGVSNGLDFCQALRGASQLAGTADRVHVDPDTPLAQAYVLVDPGARDADDNGALLDGRNGNGLGFELPAHPQGRAYDDQVLSVGFSQLAARLGCPTLMARVNSAARAAVVARDVADLTAFFRDFRAYSVRVSEDALVLAGLGVVLAQVDAALTLVDTGIALVQAIDSNGASLTPTAVVLPIAAGLSIEAIIEAAIGVKEAEEALTSSRQLHGAAVDEADATSARAAEQLTLTKLNEQRVRLK